MQQRSKRNHKLKTRCVKEMIHALMGVPGPAVGLVDRGCRVNLLASLLCTLVSPVPESLQAQHRASGMHGQGYCREWKAAGEVV